MNFYWSLKLIYSFRNATLRLNTIWWTHLSYCLLIRRNIQRFTIFIRALHIFCHVYTFSSFSVPSSFISLKHVREAPSTPKHYPRRQKGPRLHRGRKTPSSNIYSCRGPVRFLRHINEPRWKLNNVTAAFLAAGAGTVSMTRFIFKREMYSLVTQGMFVNIVYDKGSGALEILLFAGKPTRFVFAMFEMIFRTIGAGEFKLSLMLGICLGCAVLNTYLVTVMFFFVLLGEVKNV